MRSERLRPPRDPERDPTLAHWLREEFGASDAELAHGARLIAAAVARRTNEARAWWSVIPTWSRTVVPIGLGLAAAAALLALQTPSELMTRFPTSYPAPASTRDVAVVDIIATQTTSGDVVAAFIPPTRDALLEAAWER